MNKEYTPFKHGSLFSGIGGFDLAAEWMGWENVFHCEWNEFGKRVLNYYWPNAESFSDITKTDFTKYANKIDILTGGFPCQPYSMAGKRLGTEDNRHLWPEMLRAIREITPSYIVGENVYGLVNWNGGLVFNEVQTDLEAEGYEVQPVILPACGKNAPHKRERVWFVAYNTNARVKNLQQQRENGIYKTGITSNSAIKRRKAREQNTRQSNQTENRTRMELRTERLCNDGDITNSINTGPQGNEQHREYKEENKTRETGTHGPTTKFYRGDNWRKWPTQSPICSRNDGLSSELDGITFPKWRNESIKAYGNAVVPQVVYEIFKAIQMTEQSK